mmetsp:Transcript_5794/g.7143  ORF Transcript_5794/g.7143 Transcript_5794/m.7143 type:complete len:128 (-) Transcript_5794:28-411(-)
MNGHTKILNLLLTRDDLDVNVQDQYGMTGFHLACQKGHTEIINLLLTRDDLDINVQDWAGKTGFNYACTLLYGTSPRSVAEIGALICIRRNMQPSELMDGASRVSYPEMIEEIQTSISRNEQKSARK